MRAQAESIVNHSAAPPRLACGPVLQRKCACGQHTPGGAECGHCKNNTGNSLQPNSVNNSAHADFISGAFGETRSTPVSADGLRTARPDCSFLHDFSQVRAQQVIDLPERTEEVGRTKCDLEKGKMDWSVDKTKLPSCVIHCAEVHEQSHERFWKGECAKVVGALNAAKEATKKAVKTRSDRDIDEAQKKIDKIRPAARVFVKWHQDNCREDERRAYQAGIDACSTKEAVKLCADQNQADERKKEIADWKRFRDNPPNCAAAAPAPKAPPTGQKKPPEKKGSAEKSPENKSETHETPQRHEKSRMVQQRSALPGPLQRKCACGERTSGGGECEQCKKHDEMDLQRRSNGMETPGTAPPIVYDVLRSSGQPLDAATRAYFEPRFGYDFSAVRVHSDMRAAESARTVNALAYTVGRDVVFGLGQFAPTSISGRRLIAHELAHVVQQSVGQGLSANKSSYPGISRVSAAPDALRINDADDPSEHEADRLADAVIRPMTSTERSTTVRPLVNSSPRIFRVPQADVPTKAEEKEDQKLNDLARYPSDAIPAWKRLNGKAQVLVFFKMMGRYGEEFATDFLKYAERKKKPALFTTFTNLAKDNPKSLYSRGYRLAGNRGGSPRWVHPSGHEYILIQSTKATTPTPQPVVKPDADETQKQQDMRKRCIDPCLLETDDQDACNKCCEKIPADDEHCRRACEASCEMKL